MLAIQISIKETGSKIPWNLEADLDGETTMQQFADFAKRTLITIATDVLHEEQEKGFDKNPKVRVDNVWGKSIDNVLPFGKIEYFSKLSSAEIVEALKTVYMKILLKSPVYSGPERSDTIAGLYRDNNVVVFNGEQVANDWATFSSWIEGRQFTNKDTIRFLNTVSYARRLELLGVRLGSTHARIKKFEKKSKHDKTDKRRMTAKMPNGTYFLTFVSVKRLFPVLTEDKFKFEFVSGDSIGVSTTHRGEKATFKTSSKKSGSRRSVGRAYLYPSIVIRLA